MAAAAIIAVKLLNERARLPERAYDGDAAFDLYSAEVATLAPQSRTVVGTGVAVGLPAGMAALTLPRSGLAARHGIALVNAPGLIDPGYRGEIKLILLNTDMSKTFEIQVGDRIGQLLIVGLSDVALSQVAELEETARGERGFGSSGTGEIHNHS